MNPNFAKQDVIKQLQQEILALQGHRKTSGNNLNKTGLGILEQAFHDQTFPIGAVHEFISRHIEEVAATNGFLSGLVGSLMKQKGACLWVSTNRTVFPQALKIFGIEPERIIFIDTARPKEALWTIEEGLKCEALSVVIGEIRELSFTESRRLQLAVEHSHVTGFIHRQNPKTENTVACVTRWKIKPLPSDAEQGMPGVGFPRWDVHLLKVRNGKPGNWQLEWADSSFQYIAKQRVALPDIHTRKAG